MPGPYSEQKTSDIAFQNRCNLITLLPIFSGSIEVEGVFSVVVAMTNDQVSHCRYEMRCVYYACYEVPRPQAT